MLENEFEEIYRADGHDGHSTVSCFEAEARGIDVVTETDESSITIHLTEEQSRALLRALIKKFAA